MFKHRMSEVFDKWQQAIKDGEFSKAEYFKEMYFELEYKQTDYCSLMKKNAELENQLEESESVSLMRNDANKLLSEEREKIIKEHREYVDDLLRVKAEIERKNEDLKKQIEKLNAQKQVKK